MPDSGAGVTFVVVVVVLLLLLVLVAWYQHSKSQGEKNKSHQNLAAQKQMKGDALRRGRRFPCDSRWRPGFAPREFSPLIRPASKAGLLVPSYTLEATICFIMLVAWSETVSSSLPGPQGWLFSSGTNTEPLCSVFDRRRLTSLPRWCHVGSFWYPHPNKGCKCVTEACRASWY